MARKRDAQGAASSPARRDQDRSSMRSSRTSRAVSSSREEPVSQSGRAARAARSGSSASEGRPSRISGDASSSRSSRSQESSVRSRRDAQRGSQARTSARPSRREPEIDPAQESRDAARQRLQARAAATQQERSSLSEGTPRPARADTLMRTARRTAVSKDEPQTEDASPSTNARARRGTAQSARRLRAEGKRRSQVDQTNNVLGGEQGIPHNVLKNPMKPSGGKGSGSSEERACSRDWQADAPGCGRRARRFRSRWWWLW